jgi:uncharacterized protein
VLRTQRRLKLLGPADLPEVTALLARDPVVNVVCDYRARLTQLQPRWLGGEMWGYYEGSDLLSVCHSAANLMPAMATPEAIDRFAERALWQGRRCWTVLGPSSAVEPMWERLSREWPAPREVRHGQRHLEIHEDPLVEPDPLVRRSTLDELDIVYPASVAMYTEEVGVSPEEHGGGATYRARVAQLISRHWSFVRIEDGRVVFKAEVAAATPHACQVQDVYVAPDRRGEGLASAGVAAVVATALREIAPVVALYVNDGNVAARRVYEKIGFRQTETFTTVLF